METDPEKRRALQEMGLDPDQYSFTPPTPAAPIAQGNDSSAAGAAFRGAKRAAIPTVAGVLGTAGAVALMPETGGLSGLLIPLLAGAGAGYGAGALQEKIAPTTPDEAAQYQKDVAQHPLATVGGELVPSLMAFKPSLSNLKTAGQALARREFSNPQLLNVGVNAGLGALQETALPALRGEDVDWKRAAAATIGGAALSEPNRIGQRLGFHPSQSTPRTELTPELTPRVGYDSPIGPDELLGNKLQREMVPGDSSLTQLYRSRYGNMPAVDLNAGFNAAADTIGKLPNVGAGPESAQVPAAMVPTDVYSAFKETMPAVEPRIQSAEENRLNRIAYLEKQLADAQDAMSRMPLVKQIDVVPQLEILHQKLIKAKQEFQAKAEAQKQVSAENAIPLSDAVNKASGKTVYVDEKGNASEGPLGRTSDKKPLESLAEKAASEQAASTEVAQDRVLASKMEKPAQASAQAIDKSLQPQLTPEQKLEIAKQIWMRDPQSGVEPKAIKAPEQAPLQQKEFQFQEAIKGIPAEHLLAHPLNADILAATERLAERHNVTLKRNDNPILTPDGKLASGSAEISKRLASYNGNLATVDTGLHELGHVFLDDLRTSINPAERSLHDSGLALFGGNEEKLIQAVGLRSTELLKNRIEGNTLARFKAWAKDFWSLIKQKWGKATSDDLKNLMARRMVYGEAIARGEIVPRTQAEKTRFQTAEQSRQDAKEVTRGNELANEIRKNDFSLPLLRSVIESVRRLPFGGEHLATALSKFYDVRNDMLGKYKNAAFLALRKLSDAEKTAISERMFAERENPNYTPKTISPAADEAYKQVRGIFDAAAAEANARGIKVMDGENFREIFINHKYIPHMISADAFDILAKKQGSPEWRKLRDDYVQWVMDGGLKGKAAGVDNETALAMWNERSKGSLQDKPKTEGGYGPLEQAAGLGLPASMREKNLETVLSRYFERYSQKVAWFDTIENHTPENAITRTLLDATDQFGKKDQNAKTFPDGKEINVLAQNPHVQSSIKDMLKNYDARERFVESIDRVVKSLMLQTITGSADFVGGISNAAQHLQLTDYLTLLPKAVAGIADGIKAGYRRNVIQLHAARMQSPIEGGVLPHQLMSERLIHVADRLNGIADGIYKITGRDAFEKWGRGLLMNLGMIKTESVMGKVRAGTQSPADVKWLDTFLGKGQWEAIGKDGNFKADTLEKAGAKFVESVQGTYDARGLPAWALSGTAAPFVSLARWNLEKANNFTKFVLNPLRHGDVGPFLKMTMLGMAGGEAIQQIRQLITGKKPQAATWDEIEQAGGEGLGYRALSSMTLSGYSGALADVLKQGLELSKGQQPMGFRFPLVSAVATSFNRVGQFASALGEGENILDAVVRLPVVMAKDQIQMVRALTRFVSEDEAEQVSRANQARDLRMFRDLNNIPQPTVTQSGANPFLNPLKKDYQRTQDIGEAVQKAPQLTQLAMERGAGDLELTRNLLRNYASPNTDLMPSLQGQPEQFRNYLDWIGQTQGDSAKQEVLQGYVRKQQMDKLKSALIPRL